MRLRLPKRVLPKPELYPTLTATNAYQLLDEVAAAIISEPRRLDMRHWVTEARRLLKLSPKNVPECGTVACAAGWICALVNPSMVANAAVTGDEDGVVARAREILGSNDKYDDFSCALGDLFQPAGNDLVGLRVGSKNYALAVVRRIRQLQHDYRDRLLDTPVSA